MEAINAHNRYKKQPNAGLLLPGWTQLCDVEGLEDLQIGRDLYDLGHD